MIIKIEHPDAMGVSEDATEFKGATIVDADEGLLWLEVDPSEIDMDCSWWQVKEPFEAWGQKGLHDCIEYDIRSCVWEGHSVLNEEEVFEKTELFDE